MRRSRPRRSASALRPSARLCLAGLLVLAAAFPPALRAEAVTLKTGQTLHGIMDKDGTLVQVYDLEGVVRYLFRDSKIESVRDESLAQGERFKLVQPMTVHAGVMPPFAVHIETTPWDQFGRRKFSYQGTRSGKRTKMTQALIELTPFSVKLRGVDNFWKDSRLDLSQVPKEVILGLLAKVDQSNQNERLRVGRFLIQAKWYAEALRELDRLAADFPDLKDTVATVHKMVIEDRARDVHKEIAQRRQAGQPRQVFQMLRSFPTEGAPVDVLEMVRNDLRIAELRQQEDRALASLLGQVADDLSPEQRQASESRLLEMLHGISEAPDAVRARLDPFRLLGADVDPEARFSMALSGWVMGAEGATVDARDAEVLWQARDLALEYLQTTSSDEARRANLLAALRKLRRPGLDGGPDRPIDLKTLTTLVQAMRPPLSGLASVPASQIRTLRIQDDPNPNQPTEYAVRLPREYHPLRSYPALVSLHGPETPSESLQWLEEEADRHGFILIAPEYNLRDQPRSYRYTPSEHAAVELSLRDARRRFAIDADRVFVVGVLEGGNMAWDLGLGHPDLFAGVAVISGLPGKYVWETEKNHPLVPFFIAEGSIAVPDDAGKLISDKLIRPLITRNVELLYAEYFQRGLEAFPETAPSLFDWMIGRTRDHAPKTFEAVSARTCDNRFYGVVIRDFSPRRAMPPGAVDPLGRNLKPASIEFRDNDILNKLMLTTSGISALDVWVTPELFEFDKKLEVQVNNRTYYKGEPDLTDLGPFLEDQRLRGDRKQIYWLRVSIGGRSPR